MATALVAGCADDSPGDDAGAQGAVPLEQDVQANGVGPRVAIAADGTAFVVWSEAPKGTGQLGEIWVSRLAEDASREPEALMNDPAVDATGARIAVDSVGNALAVFNAAQSSGSHVMASRYEVGSGWAAAEVIDEGAPTCSAAACPQTAPDLALDADGNGFAVWLADDGVRKSVWARPFQADSGWGDPEQLDLDQVGSSFSPVLALDTAGGAVVAWTTDDPSLQAARFVPGQGWSASTRVDPSGSDSVIQPFVSVAASADGSAIVLYADGDLLAARYSMGAWTEAAPIEDSAESFRRTSIGMDASGAALLVSTSAAGSVWSASFDPAGGWTRPVLVDVGDGEADNPKISVTSSGNAMAVWQQKEDLYARIWASELSPSSGWSLPEKIDGETADQPRNVPDVALNDAGQSVVAWELFVFEQQQTDIWAVAAP